MANVPIICRSCGDTSTIALSRVAALKRCVCGSTDLDLHVASETSAYDRGKADFAAGKERRVPSDLLQWHGNPGDTDTSKAKDWYRGWDAANIAAPVEASRKVAETACPARRKHDGAHCQKGLGHGGGHQYQEDRRYQDASDQAKKKQAGYGPAMDLLDQPTAIAQVMRCSSCFGEFQVTVIDPAQPLPDCPDCGSKAVSAAGATATTTARLVKQIKATNPHLPATTAMRVARKVLARFPRVAGDEGPPPYGPVKGWCPMCHRDAVWVHDPLVGAYPGAPDFDDRWVCENSHEATTAELTTWIQERTARRRAAQTKVAGSPREIGPDERYQVGDEVGVSGGFYNGLTGVISRGGWYNGSFGQVPAYYVKVGDIEMGPFRDAELDPALPHFAQRRKAKRQGRVNVKVERRG